MREISFYGSEDCSDTSKIKTIPTKAFDSGNVFGQPGNSTFFYSPSKAFDNTIDSWGGRSDDRGYFWIGMTFQSDVNVRCVALEQDSLANVVYIQTRQAGDKAWRNVWIAKNLSAKNFIPFTNPPTAQPSSQPTVNPTSIRTNHPVTFSPTSSPIRSPLTLPQTSNPTRRPVSIPPTSNPISRPVSLPSPINLDAPVVNPPSSSNISCKQRCRRLFFIFRRAFQMHKITQIGCIEKCFGTVQSGTSKGYVCGKCPS